MVFNGTTVPTGRDNTYSAGEIHRKSAEEKYATAFNKDQKAFLEELILDIAGLTTRVTALEDTVSGSEEK